MLPRIASRWLAQICSPAQPLGARLREAELEEEEEEGMASAIEVLRSEQAVQFLQRVARGLLARSELRRLQWATELSQRQWRAQRNSIAVLQVQLAARTMRLLPVHILLACAAAASARTAVLTVEVDLVESLSPRARLRGVAWRDND